MKARSWKVVLILLLTMSMLSGVLSAQGGILNYGDTVSHQLDTGTPQALYSFTGNAGDVVTVYALGWTAEFQPAITILGPTGQVGFSNTDALSPIDNDARVTVALPQAGSYSVLVASASGSLGQFTLALRLTTPQAVIPLNEAVTINFPAGAEAQAFSLTGTPGAETPLQITSATPDFAFAGYISAPDGHILAAFDGSLSTLDISLPPASPEDGPYVLVLYGADSTQAGDLFIQPGEGSASPDIPQPASTEEVSTDPDAPAPPADQCAAVAGEQGLNVRRGPSTNFDIITTLLPGQYLIIDGQNAGWYTGNALGEQGWVAGSVITLTGPCSNLPFVQAPAPPSNPTPPPSQPTATNSASPTPSPTTDSGLTPPAATEDAGPTPTATYTQPVQTAPPDNQHNLNIDRDNGGQYTDAVSYPGGDTSDRVRVTINNLTNFVPNNTRTVNLTLVCTGSGTQNITWGTGGPDSPRPLACGQSTSSFHTDDSNQTFVNIHMEGPEYVTWTLVATTSQ